MNKKILTLALMGLSLMAVGALAGQAIEKHYSLREVKTLVDQARCAEVSKQGALIFDIDETGERVSEGYFACLIEQK
jgi:hypothetical protein